MSGIEGKKEGSNVVGHWLHPIPFDYSHIQMHRSGVKSMTSVQERRWDRFFLKSYLPEIHLKNLYCSLAHLNITYIADSWFGASDCMFVCWKESEVYKQSPKDQFAIFLINIIQFFPFKNNLILKLDDLCKFNLSLWRFNNLNYPQFKDILFQVVDLLFQWIIDIKLEIRVILQSSVLIVLLHNLLMSTKVWKTGTFYQRISKTVFHQPISGNKIKCHFCSQY